MNFLKGELVEQNGKIGFAANGVHFSLVGYQAAEPLVAGRKVTLGLRP